VCGSYKNFVSVKSSEWLGQVGDWPSQSNLSWRGTWTAGKAVALYAWQGRTSRWATHVTQCRHATLDKCFACSSHWRDTNATGERGATSSRKSRRKRKTSATEAGIANKADKADTIRAPLTRLNEKGHCTETSWDRLIGESACCSSSEKKRKCHQFGGGRDWACSFANKRRCRGQENKLTTAKTQAYNREYVETLKYILARPPNSPF